MLTRGVRPTHNQKNCAIEPQAIPAPRLVSPVNTVAMVPEVDDAAGIEQSTDTVIDVPPIVTACEIPTGPNIVTNWVSISLAGFAGFRKSGANTISKLSGRTFTA